MKFRRQWFWHDRVWVRDKRGDKKQMFSEAWWTSENKLDSEKEGNGVQSSMEKTILGRTQRE